MRGGADVPRSFANLADGGQEFGLDRNHLTFHAAFGSREDCIEHRLAVTQHIGIHTLNTDQPFLFIVSSRNRSLGWDACWLPSTSTTKLTSRQAKSAKWTDWKLPDKLPAVQATAAKIAPQCAFDIVFDGAELPRPRCLSCISCAHRAAPHPTSPPTIRRNRDPSCGSATFSP